MINMKEMRGRPPINPKNKLDAPLTAYFTDDEREDIRAAARVSNCTTANWIRRQLLKALEAGAV